MTRGAVGMGSLCARACIPALTISLVACDLTSPEGKALSDFILDFCSDEIPNFVAYQNEGGPWTRVTPDAAGTVTIAATQKVAVAIVGLGDEDLDTDVVYGTRDEFQAMNGLLCLERFSGKTLSGSISALSTTQWAGISMGASSDVVFPPATQFQLFDLPDRPLDLVAHRQTDIVPDRVIVRRAISQVSGTTISPPLDFDAANALASATLTTTGLTTNETGLLFVGFGTATGTDHLLHFTFSNASSQSLFGVPATLTQDGDLHRVIYFASDPDARTVRGVAHFHRNLASRTAALGPFLGVPTITTVSASPLLMRAQLASQSEYGALAAATFSHSGTDFYRSFSVVVTAGHLGGTPTTWDLRIPDLNSVSGFPSIAAFPAGATPEWYVEASSGGPDVFIGGPPSDGLSVMFAERSQPFTTLMSGMGRSTSRPRGVMARRLLGRR